MWSICSHANEHFVYAHEIMCCDVICDRGMVGPPHLLSLIRVREAHVPGMTNAKVNGKALHNT